VRRGAAARHTAEADVIPAQAAPPRAAPGASELRELRKALHGRVLTPADAGYEAARRVYNATVDRRPALIVRCAGPGDVRAAVAFSAARGWHPAVRGGGHGVAGHAVCDGGMVIDLSPMKGVRVDPAARTARAEGGVTWGELDRATGAFGLAAPGGIVSTTGIAGLTLGGGVGWLVRHHGLACDNLLSAEVAAADGRLLAASADEHPDLFWALRGGGGNFGVVTSLTYRLHPVGTVLGGMVLHPRGRAREVLRFYRDFAPAAPDALTTSLGLMTSPDGVPLVALVACWSGPPAEGEAAVRQLRAFGPPLEDRIALLPFPRMQRLMDDAFPAGRRNYWKSDFLRGLPDEAVDAVVEHAARAPSPHTAVLLESYTGAAARVAGDATAYPHRSAPFNLHLFSAWTGAEGDAANVAWTRSAWEALRPFSTGGSYVNFLGDEGEERVRAAYGPNHARLAEVKGAYDPGNLFRRNQNVRPAA
jgi:FAD/FMN-containing dehydrogenase